MSQPVSLLLDDSRVLTVADPLIGLRVLVVEDEMLVSMLLEAYLKELGCEVTGVAAQLKHGISKAASLPIDAAVLDVNLGEELSWPVAKALRGRGVPIIFATGYELGRMPPELGDVPVLAKPYTKAQVARALRKALQHSHSDVPGCAAGSQ